MSAKERFEQLMNLYRTGQYDEAAKGMTSALRVSPQDGNFLHLAGLIAEAQNELPRAIMFMRRALNARPNWVEATYNLARILGDTREWTEAIALMSKVAEAQPQMTQALEALASFANGAGDLPASIGYWRKALALVPNQQEWRAKLLLLSRQICDWNEPITEIEKLPPQAAVVLTDDAALQRQTAIQTATARYGKITPMPPADWAAHAKCRVGYISSDFHAHATAYLMAELFSLHDKDQFEVTAYSYSQSDSTGMQDRIKNQVQHFVDIRRMSAEQAAARIRADEIDILIDLKGYTRGSRLEILAYRPAKFQVHWLGFPGTLGAPFIDAFIADNVTIPPLAEHHFTEKVIRLPHCYQINDRQRLVGQAKSKAEYGLPEDALVLGSFNQTYKITPEVFSIWCDLLRDLPEAVLWLYESNPYATQNLRQAAEANGINPERLFFAQPLPLADHLARYEHMDLALDTFPVGGHTTTSDALWTNTPVVTMIGQSFVSRVAASLLTAAGLAELITTSQQAYRDVILSMARSPARRRQLKRHLQNSHETLPLFDTPRFVKDWEKALLQMAEQVSTST